METRIPASERTSQKLTELLTQGVAAGDARSELIKLAVRKIVEETLESLDAERRRRSQGAESLEHRRELGPPSAWWPSSFADGCGSRRRRGSGANSRG